MAKKNRWLELNIAVLVDLGQFAGSTFSVRPDQVRASGRGVYSAHGQKNVLQESRPVTQCEILAATSVDIAQLLKRRSYRLWDASDIALPLWKEIDVATHNAVIIPSEKVKEVPQCQ